MPGVKEVNEIGPDRAVFVDCTGDPGTSADKITLPVQQNVSQSLKDWLTNIIRSN